MNHWTSTMRPIALTLILTAGRSLAGTPDLIPNTAPAQTELTLANFFSTGWDEDWTRKTPLPDGAPDLALLRVQTNFLVRVARTDYYFENNMEKGAVKNVQYLNQYLEYSFNRRFMLSLFTNYTWDDYKAASEQNGLGGGAMGRFQLVDTPTSSYALNLRVDAPNTGIGVDTTKWSAAIAGWQDLSRLHAGRLGIYYDLQEETYAGDEAVRERRNDLTYDVSLAETWTRPSAKIGNLTTFAEFYGVTYLDGDKASYTAMTATPGMRFTLFKRNVFMIGVDFPLTHPSDTREVYRFTYIYNF